MNDFPELQTAINEQDFEKARDLLRPLLEAQADNPQVWYLASKAARNEAQKRYFLEQAVRLDPLFHQAANELHAMTPLPAPAPESPPAPEPRYASAKRRFAAFMVDSLVLYSLNWFVLSLVASLVEDIQSQITFLMLSPIILNWLYHGFYYRWRGGKTYGGRLFGLRVIRADGKALSFWDAFLRCVLGYFASGIALGAGFTWQFFNPKHQAWQDIVAETLVVED